MENYKETQTNEREMPEERLKLSQRMYSTMLEQFALRAIANEESSPQLRYQEGSQTYNCSTEILGLAREAEQATNYEGLLDIVEQAQKVRSNKDFHMPRGTQYYSELQEGLFMIVRDENHPFHPKNTSQADWKKDFPKSYAHMREKYHVEEQRGGRG